MDADVCDWFLFFPINQSQTSRLYHNDISEEPVAPIFNVEVFFFSEHIGSYVLCNACDGTPYVPCNVCDGTPYVPCNVCDGTPYIPCNVCGSTS